MSIADAIFSDSQSRLFRWIFGQPKREFHLNELLRLTGLGSASLQRELKRLTEAGLIVSTRVGNMRRFVANAESPVYTELVTLTRKTVGLEFMLREVLAPLQPRLRSAWIYGSVAKQTDTAQSDIDVMVVGDNLGLGAVLERLLPLESELQRKINPTCYTTEEFAHRRAESGSFVDRVMSQPLIVLFDENESPPTR